MNYGIIPAIITFTGENRDLKIALVVVFVFSVATAIWSTSRMRKRAGQSGFPIGDPRWVIAGLGLKEVVVFACCWLIGLGALLLLKNIR